MSAGVRARFEADLARAHEASQSGERESAWAALEDAHILSQPWIWPHLRTHAEMLVLAAKSRDLREATGQLVRLVVAGPGSLTGRYPVGNTGRARVSMFAPMPMPPDVASLLESSS